MDQVVQQTAANAEDRPPASKEMHAQASQMKEYVGELKSLIDGANGKGAEKAGKWGGQSVFDYLRPS